MLRVWFAGNVGRVIRYPVHVFHLEDIDSNHFGKVLLRLREQLARVVHLFLVDEVTVKELGLGDYVVRRMVVILKPFFMGFRKIFVLLHEFLIFDFGDLVLELSAQLHAKNGRFWLVFDVEIFV